MLILTPDEHFYLFLKWKEFFRQSPQYNCRYEVLTIRFQTFFVWASKIVVDSWNISMLLLYILWDDWPILEVVNFKNAIWHFRRTICNNCVLNLEKRPQKRMEYFRMLLEHLAWLEHQFLSGIRDSRIAESLWEMMRGVGAVGKWEHQSWLVKRLGLLCWDLKGEILREEIPSEEASTLQIRSVAFPAEQWTSPQFHPCHRLFDQDRHQDSSSASL